MANNNYYRHRRSGGKVWAGLIAFVLTGAIVASVLGVGTQGFKDWSFSKWFGSNEEQEQTEEVGGGALITDTTSNGISLMSTTLEPSQYSDYGVSAAAETAYTITASVTPEDSTITDFTWSVSWKNASSTWASGKTVTDYVQISSSGRTATVSNTQAFGEPVQVNCAYAWDTTIKATCQVDYLKPVTVINPFGITSSSHKVSLNNSYDKEAEFVFGLGTVQGAVTLGPDVRAELSNEAYNYLLNNQYYKTFNNLSGLELYNTDEGLNLYSSNNNTIYDPSQYYFIEEILTNNVAKYYDAAWIQLGEAMSTNVLSMQIYFEYYYNTTFITDGWAETEYCGIDTSEISSSLLTVNGVSLNNSNLVFGL